MYGIVPRITLVNWEKTYLFADFLDFKSVVEEYTGAILESYIKMAGMVRSKKLYKVIADKICKRDPSEVTLLSCELYREVRKHFNRSMLMRDYMLRCDDPNA